jgi:hypothetical protein
MLSNGGGDSNIDSTSFDVLSFNDFNDFNDGLDFEPETDI